MIDKKKISRREFLKLTGMAAAGAGVALYAPAAKVVSAASPSVPAAIASGAPAIRKARTVKLAIGSWAEAVTKDLFAKSDFTKQTGINVEFVLRTDTKETEFTRLASAMQSGTSPYDILDFEDELTTSFSQAGY